MNMHTHTPTGVALSTTLICIMVNSISSCYLYRVLRRDRMTSSDDTEVCCNVLQCVAVCCSMLQYAAVVAVCCSVLQFAAVRRSDNHYLCHILRRDRMNLFLTVRCVAVCCSMSQHVAACCSMYSTSSIWVGNDYKVPTIAMFDLKRSPIE